MSAIFFNDNIKEKAILLPNCSRFAPHGQSYYLSCDDLEGFYWTYDTEYFRVSIFDFDLKKETIYCCDLSRFPDTALFSAHIISANGEILPPYQQLSSNDSFVICNQHQILQTLLHEHTNFQAVCFDFKQKIIDDCLVGRYQLKPDDLCHIFKEANHFLGAGLGKIADEILHYKLGSSASELFYEIKAKEWLSVIINNYYATQNEQEMSQEDSIALDNVRHYINDHLMATIPQDLLAKIAMMSKTKLKTAFKTKYHMTITEYIQRRRMALAEHLLMTTQLEIKEVAIAVGYTSHSRFSSLFKKYVGVYPHDIKKQPKNKEKSPCHNCLNKLCDVKTATENLK